jgi:outer membrane receptor protein involved in Fe transport
MYKLRWVTMAVALGWTVGAPAQSQMEEEDLALAYGDKNFISIATGQQQLVRKAPSVATVITAKDIAAMGAVDIDEVLQAVPGLHVSRSSTRYASLYLIRGIGSGGLISPQVLVLQDGIPVTNMYLGDKVAAWRGTSLENIARIEVIRGPGSALYGADAYAGVINIITKTAADTPGTEVGFRAGSFGTWDSWMQHGGKAGPIDVAAYLRVGGSEGFRDTIAADAQTRNDQRFGTRASLAPGPASTGYEAIDGNLSLAYGKWRWRNGYKLRDQLGYGAGIASALVYGSESRAEVITSDLSWMDPEFARDVGLGFSGSYLHYAFTLPDNLMLLPPGTVLPSSPFPNGQIGGPNQWERQYRLSAFATYSGFSDHNLRLGAGYDNLDLYKVKTYKNYRFNVAGAPVFTGPVIDYTGIQPHILPHERTVKYLYLQDEWLFAKDWTLTAGVRYDHYSDFGSTTNPRLALVWEVAYDLTAKLLYGRAFRAPSFTEQYGINPVANGNPNLRPETIQTVEAALSWKPHGDTQINLNVFRYTMEDIIRLVGTAYQNSGSQTGNGMELEAVWDASRNVRLSAHYAYQRSVSGSTRHDPGYAPHHLFYARADWLPGSGWQLSTQVNAVVDRNRAFGDTRPQIDDYATVDLTLRTIPVKNQWDFAASVRNLFDANARDPSLYSPVAGRPDLPVSPIPYDLPLPGRSFWVQARYAM